MSDSDSQVLEKSKPKRVRSEAQLQALAKARILANQKRRENAELRRKEKANAQAERDEKRKHIEDISRSQEIKTVGALSWELSPMA